MASRIPKVNKSNSVLIRAYRLTRLVLHLLLGALTIGLLFPAYRKARRQREVTTWSAKLLRILGVRVRVRGMGPRGGTRPIMLVANHISWLDIHVLHSIGPVRFVAKADMRAWPVIGWLAKSAGTMFVDRDKRRDAARINRHIADAFAAGDCVGVFPEGTTSHGDQLQHFHGSLLQPAIAQDALLIPVALRYLGDGGGVDRSVGYVGETTLWQSLRGVLSRPNIRVRVAFLAPIDARGHHRRDLARCAEHAIASSLSVPVTSKPPETASVRANAPPLGALPTSNPYR